MFTEIKLSDIPGRKTKFNNKVAKDVIDFFESTMSAAEVNIAKYKDVASARSSYRQAIKASNVGVAVITRENRLFLIRK